MAAAACLTDPRTSSGTPSPSPVATVKQGATRLTAFGTQENLTAYLRQLARSQSRIRRKTFPLDGLGYAQSAPAAPAEAAKFEADSVTNVQHAGVDEGGIVKVQGDYLIVLRRGRLFTVRIGDDSLAPVSEADAFGPDVDPSGAWYDEMLVSEGTIVVVGYSYQRGGTELGLFDLGSDGAIHYRATYHLRSNDYYSSRNYASRLLGRKLVFYTPLYLWLDEKDPLRGLPAIRRWRPGAGEHEFRPLYSAAKTYRPLAESASLALHTVTTCDLATPEPSCAATAVMGPPGRVFYVSPSAVYVWMTDWRPSDDRRSRSLLYRLPLDGAEPEALRVAGSPVDQFSFLEADDHLNVVVRSEAVGDGMWGAEVAEGDLALLRLPLATFAEGVVEVEADRYRALPRPPGSRYAFQNRFVGDYLLYGSGTGWDWPREAPDRLVAYRFSSDGAAPVTLRLGHGVERIEALGRDAIVVGTAGRDLHFSPIALEGDERPSLGPRYTRTGATQGETRSHGFFYKPEGERSGLLGLPIRGAGRPGYEHLFRESASILFLRNENLKLVELGALRPQPAKVKDDACRASCVDWYGNARPLFLRGRVLALLGYELVEGRLDTGRLDERRRISFAPHPAAVTP
jgi:hypothetical protein